MELSTLLVLDGLDPQGESVQDIAERLDVAASTASRFVTRAAEAGMVTRTPAWHDARHTLVAPTPDGVAFPKRAAEHRLRHLAAILTTWDAADMDIFANALTRFATQATQPKCRLPSEY
ncbi:MarR family winged helix-turn-helix transcriptional regulator [Tessaracoccus antarcticus]|uniref:MarR family winged helix-turn-helix transcriptional regulator n=1 Tax=Tessaracoccus antarcticus TaxID=2479848 RepID=UPI0013140789|nr:MarR family winged helix-turn-helix transcriptional regulator [Tessaracoccus antarcticus]